MNPARCAHLVFFACTALVFFCDRASAQGQDGCANAQVISGVGPHFFSNAAALTDGLPTGLCDFAGSQDITHDVWFTWTAQSSGTHILSVCGMSSVDTKVAVYVGGCGGAVVACNDDFCGLQSEVSWSADMGVAYLLRVGTPPAAPGGTGQFTVEFVPDPLGYGYCDALPNSTGVAAELSVTGSVEIFQNDLVLWAEDLPAAQPGIFYYGPVQLKFPFGNGNQCVGSGGVGVFRLNPAIISNSAGVMSRALDYNAPTPAAGQITLGSTWNFQAWYRDPAAGGAAFNLSNAFSVTFVAGGVGSAHDGMVLVPQVPFKMGRHIGVGFSDELPLHSVLLEPFFIDIFEVTNDEYAQYLTIAQAQGRVALVSGVVLQVGGAAEALCDTNASSSASAITFDSAPSIYGVLPGREDHPMVGVSWFGCCLFANELSRVHGLNLCYDETSFACDFSANGYRLPTEAEWEYTARGGAYDPYSSFPWGDSMDGSRANYSGSGDAYEGSSPATTPVGAYTGNGFGLFDMAGNVWEWCGDWYDYDYYPSSPLLNPPGKLDGDLRVLRGGGWGDHSAYLRSAFRGSLPPGSRGDSFGFRLVAR